MSYMNKVVVITGAASGIGEKTALHFAKLSARLALLDINEESLKKVAEACEKLSRTRVFKVKVDLTKDEEVKSAIERTIKQYGRIDVLVNNAGVFHSGSILDPNLMESFDRVMATNVRAVANVIHHAGPGLIEAKGSVINVSSVAGIIAQSNVTYSVGKAALGHMTRCIALELAPKGVRVNALLPGAVKTDFMVRGGLSKEENNIAYKAAEKASPLNRLVKPEDLAEMIAFLGSDRARSITGASYVIDSGLVLCGSAAQDEIMSRINTVTGSRVGSR